METGCGRALGLAEERTQARGRLFLGDFLFFLLFLFLLLFFLLGGGRRRGSGGRCLAGAPRGRRSFLRFPSRRASPLRGLPSPCSSRPEAPSSSSPFSRLSPTRLGATPR